MIIVQRIFLGLIALAAASGFGQVHAARLSIACGAVGVELKLCEQGVKTWSQRTGHEVTLIAIPNSTTERLGLYQQLLAAGSSAIDVLQIDVIWPGMLGNYLIDLRPYSGGAENEHFQSIVRNNTFEGRLIAMPWFTDAGVLYYRKDLLEKYAAPVPTTWSELTMTAKRIQDAERQAGNSKMWGFVWQGRAYEGLTCDALEWVASNNGGTVVEQDGGVSINNPRAIEAIDTAAGWVDTITPPGVLNYTEEESRGVFQSGNAVFMRNWPYAWSLAQSEESDVRGKLGVTVLPKGGGDGRHVGTLGGWQLSVSKYSKHPELAADLVMFLVSRQEQKRRAVEGSYNPTIVSLYQDPEVLAANPFFGELYDTFVNAVSRPSTLTGAKYNKVSKEFWNAVHSVLSGRMSAGESLAKLDSTLRRLRRGGW